MMDMDKENNLKAVYGSSREGGNRVDEGVGIGARERGVELGQESSNGLGLNNKATTSIDFKDGKAMRIRVSSNGSLAPVEEEQLQEGNSNSKALKRFPAAAFEAAIELGEKRKKSEDDETTEAESDDVEVANTMTISSRENKRQRVLAEPPGSPLPPRFKAAEGNRSGQSALLGTDGMFSLDNIEVNNKHGNGFVYTDTFAALDSASTASTHNTQYSTVHASSLTMLEDLLSSAGSTQSTRTLHKTGSLEFGLGPSQEDKQNQAFSPGSVINGSDSSLSEQHLRTQNMQLRAQIASLKAKNSALTMANAALRGSGRQVSDGGNAILSPNLYSVQLQSGAARRMRLGRTASISTRAELVKLGHIDKRGISEGEYDSDTSSQVSCTTPTYHQLEFTNLSRSNPKNFIHRMEMIFRDFIPGQDDPYLRSEAFARDLISTCERVCALLGKEPRILEIRSPVYVFGDIHGNLEDLKYFGNIVWPVGMRLSAGTFLFLGDYVDRGKYGLEVVAYLLTQKLLIPDKLFLIRGNHETRAVNGWEQYYAEGSYLYQCKERFGPFLGTQVWEACNKVFDHMPLACIVDHSIFCVHGGIPCPTSDVGEKDTRLDEIRKLPCPIDIQPPNALDENHPDTPAEKANRLAFSLLWADPADQDQEVMLSSSEDGFGESSRGTGTIVFGSKAVHDFLESNKLNYIFRAHEATTNGVAVCKSAKVLTVFSTSKDHGFGGNAKSGFLLVDRKKIQAINSYNNTETLSHQE